MAPMPDHSTIAAFVSRSPKAIQSVFRKGRSGIILSAPKSACKACHLRSRCLRNSTQKTPRQVIFFREPDSAGDTAVTRMKAKIDSLLGRMIYGKRLGTVEPPFGNRRYHKGLDSFTLRTRKKVDGQWKLLALVHDIKKLAYYGL